MKKYIVALSFLSIGHAIYSQGCNEIFISEYVEGWSNNKAIELYNPTESPIDLSAYRLERYSNGSPSAAENQKLTLEGIIQPNDVFVIVLDKRDPDGTGQEAPVWDELQAVADWFACPVYDDNNAMYFNGNDAMVLRKISGNVVVDVFGKIGEDPGDPNDGGGWNNVAPDFAWSLNGATAWSANHTLIRKPDIVDGDTSPIDGFNVGAEYDSLPANTFDNLGMHSSVCGSTNIRRVATLELTVYPNPADGGLLKITAPERIEKIVFLQLNGQVAATFEGSNKSMDLDISAIPTGLYLVQTWCESGIVLTERVTVK